MSVREAEGFPVVALGASFGGIEALSAILSELPKDFQAAIAIVQHRPSEPGPLAETLSRRSKRLVRDAAEGDRLIPGCAFLAPAGKLLLINRDGSLSLSDSPKGRAARHAVDWLFESGAESLGKRLIAVVLTGFLDDGSRGAEAVHRMGGRVIVQDPATCEAPTMPLAALATGCIGLVLPLGEIGPTLARLVAEVAR